MARHPARGLARSRPRRAFRRLHVQLAPVPVLARPAGVELAEARDEAKPRWLGGSSRALSQKAVVPSSRPRRARGRGVRPARRLGSARRARGTRARASARAEPRGGVPRTPWRRETRGGANHRMARSGGLHAETTRREAQPRSSRDGAAEDAGARAGRSGDDDGPPQPAPRGARERPCGVRASRVARLSESYLSGGVAGRASIVRASSNDVRGRPHARPRAQILKSKTRPDRWS